MHEKSFIHLCVLKYHFYFFLGMNLAQGSLSKHIPVHARVATLNFTLAAQCTRPRVTATKQSPMGSCPKIWACSLFKKVVFVCEKQTRNNEDLITNKTNIYDK